MAFGFGFNKQKALSAAEKYVQQGKLQNAIAEYEKILKNDAKELTVLNTVGDLYARLGETDKATDCFKSVGDAYATQGFTVKAIAMYKKISKLKPSLENVLKLAELYTQQGLFNDARAQYLQVAEEFLKAGELDNAVRIFQKILEMDPENVAMRVRLAEVYVRLGKKDEAWQIFSAAAESMRSKGSLSGAEEVLQRMLTLDPGNSYALLLQSRNLLESGDAEAAAASLLKISDLDSNPEGLRDLLKAYLQTGKLSDAGTIANKLLTVHNDLTAISTFADALMQAGQYENALQVYEQHAERLLAENPEKVLENLHIIIGHVRENPASLEKLLDLFQKAGESTHISEVTELLAHASVQSGDLPRARDLYQKLATLEPHNPLHMKSYQQVVGQLGGPASNTKLITAEEGAVMVDELEATSPAIHQHYSDEVALAVRSALTDAELFISYNMPEKALGPLVSACAHAPHDLRINQRLAALHTRAERFAEAAVCCRTLQNIYSEAGYPEEATRYGELAERYEERSSSSTAVAIAASEAAPGVGELAEEHTAQEVAVEEITIDEPSEIPAASPWPSMSSSSAAEGTSAAEVAEFSVVDEADAAPVSSEAVETPAEIDLSEWEDSVTVEGDAPQEVAAEADVAATVGDHEVPNTGVIEIIDEMRFYIAHGMPDQARVGLEKLRALTRDESMIARMREEIEAASREVAAKKQNAVVKAEVPEAAETEEFAIEEIAAEDIPSAEDLPAEESVPAEEITAEIPVVAEPAALAETHTSPELPIVEPEAEPAVEPVVAEPAAAEAAASPLQEFVTDLESSLGGGFTPETVAEPVEAAPEPVEAPVAIPTEIAPAAPPQPVAQATAATPKAPVLGEFVADLEASLGEDFLKAAPTPSPEAAPAPVPTPAAAKPAAPPVAKTVPPPVAAPAAPATMAASAAAGATATHAVPPVQQVHAATTPAVPATPIMPPMPVQPPTTAKASPFGEEAGIDLAEMFGELKQDLESGVAAEEEDPETHYNLGVAFREMGLLDEAIGELQKACQSIDRGRIFPQTMQAYTWLAQCFLDKGVPEAAVRWYEKALNVPGIDGETRVALHYELASAFQTSGDKSSALKHFMDVYGSNIDYRDVSERIKALKS